MTIRLVFDAGSLAGRSWDLPEGGALEIGRSRSCGIRPAEPDVSGRHAVVRDESGRPVLEVFSAHRTSLDGERLAAGDVRPLAEGSRVLLGDALRFRVHFGDAGADGGETMAVPEPSRPAGPANAESAADDSSEGGETTPGGPADDAETAGGPATALGPDADDADDGETQMLKTQAVSREELEMLRGAHLRRQKHRLVLHAVLLLILLGVAVGVYEWLSSEKVKTAFDSSIINIPMFPDGDSLKYGQFWIAVPDYNDGTSTVKNVGVFYRWDTHLGDNWEVPYRVLITNYIDRESLEESREQTFHRWQKANSAGWRWDSEYVSPPLFLGGDGGNFPGVRCLQHKYYRTYDGENYVGTATFFRCADRCHVLLRELPLDEEWRGRDWIANLRKNRSLRVFPRLPDGSENPFAALHWEGLPETNVFTSAEADLIVNDCKALLGGENAVFWGDTERRLSLVLRSVHGKTDDEAEGIRARALNQLHLLRVRQRDFWNGQVLRANAKSAPTAPSAGREPALKAIQKETADWFPSADDERHWLVRREKWWKMESED